MTRTRRGSGSVFYDKTDRTWRAQVLVAGKRRTIGRAKTKAGATQLVNDYHAGKVSLNDSPAPKADLGERLAWWRDVILPVREHGGRPLAPATVAQYRWALTELVEGLGDHSLEQLSAEHVERFLVERSDRLGRNSLRILRMALGLVLDEEIRRDRLQRNVARIAVRPKTAPPRERRALSGDECTRLLAAAVGTDFEHLFALLLFTGARRGELSGLSWSSVDIERQTITIRQGLRRSANGAWEIGDPKTTSSVRTIRISAGAIAHLRARQVDQLGEQVECPTWSNPLDLVFTSPTGHHLDPRRVSRKWEELTKAAGIEGVVLHELRHTMGSHLVDAGVPLPEVADRFGHANLDQVSRTYRHRVAPVVEGGADVMDVFAPETPTA